MQNAKHKTRANRGRKGILERGSFDELKSSVTCKDVYVDPHRTQKKGVRTLTKQHRKTGGRILQRRGASSRSHIPWRREWTGERIKAKILGS